jgi:hypothetical protein
MAPTGQDHGGARGLGRRDDLASRRDPPGWTKPSRRPPGGLDGIGEREEGVRCQTAPTDRWPAFSQANRALSTRLI